MYATNHSKILTQTLLNYVVIPLNQDALETVPVCIWGTVREDVPQRTPTSFKDSYYYYYRFLVFSENTLTYSEMLSP